MFRCIVVLAAFATALISDQASKALMINVLEQGDSIWLAPFANLILVYNRGISFGMFADLIGTYPVVASLAKMVIVVGLLAWAFLVITAWESAALSLIAGGAAGNIADRLRNGEVTDFIDLHAGGWHWPTFNMADIWIVSGSLIIAVLCIFGSPGGAVATERSGP